MADIKLHDRLATMGHMSPFEHPGERMSENDYFSNKRVYHISKIDHLKKDIERGITNAELLSNGLYEVTEFGWSGNFRGFTQYRKMLDGENKR